MLRDIFILLAAIAVMVAFKLYALHQSPPESSLPSLLPWAELKKTQIHIDFKTGDYIAQVPASTQAMAGKPLTLTGYLTPIEIAGETKHFLLTRRTASCPFCAPGEPNEIVDLWLSAPERWQEGYVTATGTFGLMNDPRMGLFFKMTDATLVPQANR